MWSRKWIVILWMASLPAAGAGRALAAAESPGPEQVSFEKSVVLIRSVKQDFDYVTPWKQKAMSQGAGSGFVIAGKRILTNAHNVSNWRYIELRKENVAKRYPARVAFVGHDCDLLYPGLHSVSYKDYLKVPHDQDGVVVIATIMHSSVESILKPNDVITQIDDYNIDNDAMVRIHGLTLHLSEAIETKQIGQTAEITFYRRGKRIKETATVALNRPIFEYASRYDLPPRYICYAGLTFVPATRNYLETWGREWLTDIPYYLRYLFNNSTQLNTDRRRKEYVVLAEIMPDEINSYCSDFKSQVVETINGIPIRGLDDVHKAFKQPVDDYHILKFAGDNRTLPVDAKKAQFRQQLILNKYQIPAEARLEGKS